MLDLTNQEEHSDRDENRYRECDFLVRQIEHKCSEERMEKTGHDQVDCVEQRFSSQHYALKDF